MAHIEQQVFCNSVKELHPSFFSNVFVLDIGALDINGNNKVLFEESHYLGLDVALGRNVDIVSKGHELGLPDETFDTIISTECFEHDQYYPETIKNIYRMLKPGGLFLFTCATTGRPEHGTRRTTPEDAPLLQGFTEWSDYYKNLTEDDIKDVFGDINQLFSKFEFSVNPKTCDLYFWGIKHGVRVIRDDYSFMLTRDKFKIDIEEIKSSVDRLSKISAEENINLKQENEKLIEDFDQLKLELEQKERQINGLYSDISELKSSTSWRLTSPLRVIKTQSSRIYSGEMFDKLSRLINLFLNNPKICIKAVNYAKKHGVKQTINRLKFAATTPNSPTFNHAWFDINAQETVYILSTHHCQYIAELIQINLEKLSIKSEIIYSKPENGFSSNLHFVICPQIFDELPPLYIAYQMEQAVSSRWFTDSYFDILRSSYAIFDYSEYNLDVLQKNDISLKQLYYVPIGQKLKSNCKNDTNYAYDVLFYGDINNKRRKEYISKLKEKFNVKIVNNLFGDDLIKEFEKAKVIVNIHYYEGALLETTRIYECLSNNKLVISEKSADQSAHTTLNDIVEFVEIGDIDQMVERVNFWVNSPDSLQEKLSQNAQKLSLLPDLFEYYFMRFMLANDWITFEQFYDIAGGNISFESTNICLGLPESVERHKDFEKDNAYGFEYFPGLRHNLGWVGCGLSYKFIVKKAKELGFETVTVCEDDVEFPEDFESRLENIRSYLSNQNNWQLFSGLIADLNKETNVSKVDFSSEEEFLHIDKMTSTVLNIYSSSFYDLLLAWDDSNRCAETNTIDRYIESNNDCNVITTSKFLVGHKEELDSTLWGFSNQTYTEMIKASESKLNEKKEVYLAQNNKL